MNNANYYTETRCQFYITLLDYGKFTANPNYQYFVISVEGGRSHRAGSYKIPKAKIIKMIETWKAVGDIDWLNNGKHSSTTIPCDLIMYFHDQHQLDYLNKLDKVLDTSTGYDFKSDGNIKIESTESYLKRKGGN